MSDYTYEASEYTQITLEVCSCDYNHLGHLPPIVQETICKTQCAEAYTARVLEEYIERQCSTIATNKLLTSVMEAMRALWHERNELYNLRKTDTQPLQSASNTAVALTNSLSVTFRTLPCIKDQ